MKSGGAPRVEVLLPALLRSAAGGKASVVVEAATFRACLDELVVVFPHLAAHLFDDQGTLRPHVNIFLNDQSCRWLEDWNIALEAGDTVTILQAVSGG